MMTSVPVALVNMTAFGPEAQLATCGSCGYEGLSKAQHSNGVLTWLVFGLLCFFGCWFGCCLIPFCCDSCRNTEHYCQNCKGFLGVYKRM